MVKARPNIQQSVHDAPHVFELHDFPPPPLCFPSQVQAEQLADLNGKLRLVEKLRNENSEREAEIAAALRQQQRQR